MKRRCQYLALIGLLTGCQIFQLRDTLHVDIVLAVEFGANLFHKKGRFLFVIRQEVG